MRSIPADENVVYPPAPIVREFNGIPVVIDTPEKAHQRLSSHLLALLGVSEEGGRNKAEDPFLADVATVVDQLQTAIATLESISLNWFHSTEDKPAHRDGERVFTPQEAARYALDEIRKADKPHS